VQDEVLQASRLVGCGGDGEYLVVLLLSGAFLAEGDDIFPEVCYGEDGVSALVKVSFLD